MPQFSDIPYHIVSKYFIDLLTDHEVSRREKLFVDGDLLWKDVLYDKNSARDVYFRDMPNSIPRENVLDIINTNWNLHFHQSISYAKKSYLIGPMTSICAGEDSSKWKEYWINTDQGFKSIKLNPIDVRGENNFIYETKKQPTTDIYDVYIEYKPPIPEKYQDIEPFGSFRPFIKSVKRHKSDTFLIYNDDKKLIEIPLDKVRENDVIFSRFGEEKISSIIYHKTIETSDTIFNPNDPVFIRKDSYFYEWVKKFMPEFQEQIALTKMFLYFGPIFKNKYFIGNREEQNQLISNRSFVSEEDNNNSQTVNISFYGMKDYVVSALPEVNRTPRFSEMLTIWFDRIHQLLYKKQKEVKTLYDPYEVETNILLNELASTFDINFNRVRLDNFRIRQFVKNYIYFLKRKGTYVSLIIIWHLLNTRNKLYIYDAIHNEYIRLYNNLTKEFSVLPHIREELHITSDFNKTLPDYVDLNITEKPFIIKKDFKELVWELHHDMNTKNINVYVYDESYNLIIPDKVTFIDNFNIKIEFRRAVNGWCFILKPNTFVFNDLNQNEIVIDNPYNKKSIVTIYDYKSNQFKPKNIQLSNDNKIKITNNTSLNKTFINIIEGTYQYYHGTASTESKIYHFLGKKGVIVQCYDLDFNIVIPKNIQLLNDNICLIKFESNFTGFINIKTVTDFSDFRQEGDKLSTHYKIEMNLNNEPIDENSIISKDTIETLYESWENIRPITRYSHYRIILNPSAHYIKEKALYDTNNYKTNFITNCVVREDLFIDGYKHRQIYKNRIWTVKHDLESFNIIYDFYNENNHLIKPKKILVVDNNNIEVHFEKDVSGYALVAKSFIPQEHINVEDVIWKTEIPYWYRKDVLINITDENNNHVFFPKRIDFEIVDQSAEDSSHEIKSKYNYPKKGKMCIFNAEFTYEKIEEDKSKIWEIEHNLKMGVIVQCFDHNNNMIIPKNIILKDQHICVVEFEKEEHGFANIIAISNLVDDIREGYFKIGSGGSLSHYKSLVTNSYQNDINTEIYKGKFTYIHETHDAFYVQLDLNANEPRNDLKYNFYEFPINEIALFDFKGLMMFYTYCGEIYKIKDCNLRLIYKIYKFDPLDYLKDYKYLNRDYIININIQGDGYFEYVTPEKDIYRFHDIITIKSYPNKDSVFIGWYENGDLVTTNNTLTIQIIEDRNLVAVFEDNRTGFLEIITEGI